MTTDKIKEINFIFDAFNIDAECIDISQNRKIDTYSIRLFPGTRVRQIEKFSDEISLMLKAKAKPIINICHNEGIVKLQVMTGEIDKINLFDEIIDIKYDDDMLIPAYLGNTFEDKKVIIDLAKNPHMLIAGSTGSGKSTLLHTIIANIIINDSKLFIIDTKNSEYNDYSKYKNIEIFDNYTSALQLVEMLILVMNKRYKLMEKNKIKISQNGELSPIVLMIDEFADLIVSDENKKLQLMLAELTQKSRAAGIHCVLSTQRPSSDVINGTIKANFPARISCKVSSAIDSRVVLDKKGAELLSGSGDSIINNYNYDFVRFQTAYTSTRLNCENLNAN